MTRSFDTGFSSLFFFSIRVPTALQILLVPVRDVIVVCSSSGLGQGCPLNQQFVCTFSHVLNRSTQELR